MEFFTEAVTWLKLNYAQLLTALIALVFALETIVNLFPTKKGAGALHRIGELLDKARDKAGVPTVINKPSGITVEVQKTKTEEK